MRDERGGHNHPKKIIFSRKKPQLRISLPILSPLNLYDRKIFLRKTQP
ncbi:hypothetical protein DU19_0314 [Chlamydia muridarum]|nr:hypothetical protein DU17_0315 [Chlamydia muridarum]KDU81282.1 hypothetical protein DU18_0316 [Chlamydia muridarum]KDU82268.1 hypothetical protein DU19_0314 [Chlamydia muridarum]KDU83233.1 hypothetical protein DU20_0313 [Chlamydia muridarum]KDU84884.1 hypothetical protein DU21_0315 [Chlamydia muridarum]